jgi:hypothetical protein
MDCRGSQKRHPEKDRQKHDKRPAAVCGVRSDQMPTERNQRHMDEIKRITDPRGDMQRDARKQSLRPTPHCTAEDDGTECHADEIGLQGFVPPIDVAQELAGAENYRYRRETAPGEYRAELCVGFAARLRGLMKHRRDHTNDQCVEAMMKRKSVSHDEIDIVGRFLIGEGEQASR